MVLHLIDEFTGGVDREFVLEAGGPGEFALMLEQSGCNCEPCTLCEAGEAHEVGHECLDYICLYHDAVPFLELDRTQRAAMRQL